MAWTEYQLAKLGSATATAFWLIGATCDLLGTTFATTAAAAASNENSGGAYICRIMPPLYTAGGEDWGWKAFNILDSAVQHT